MPNILANIAKMESATTGTGTLTLGAAVTGYLSFANAGVTNGQVVTYAIEDYDVSGNIIAREVGAGTYNSTGPTLTRDTVYSSTNAGAKINCSGLQYVFVSLAKEDLATFGVLSAVNTWTANNYFNGGNVGIGTASPVARLHILSPVLGGTAGNTQLHQRLNLLTNGGSPNALLLDFTARRHTTGTDWFGTNLRVQRTIDATASGFIDFGVDGVSSSNGLGFGIGATTYMSMDNSGNVGIGTTAPASPLHVERNQAAETAIFVNNTNASGYSALRIGPSDRGTNGDGLLYSSTTATGLRSGTRPLVFETGAGSERMRLHTTGGVSINTTTDPGAGITAINSTLQIYRQNTSGEGGELRLCRSGDNAIGWYIDLVGTATGTDPNTLRFVDAQGAASRLELSSRGVLYVTNDLGPDAGDTLALGFRGAPHNDQTGTTYTFARTDAGRAVMFKGSASATWTVPLSTTTDFPIGTMIIVDNSHAIHSSLTVTVQGADGVGIRAANGAAETTTARQINRQLSRGSVATLRKLANRGSTQTVNSITFVGTTATATTAAAHGYNVGDFVEVAGAAQTQYNGTQRINTVGSTTTFTYVMSATPAANASGTLTVRAADLWNITGSFSVV